MTLGHGMSNLLLAGSIFLYFQKKHHVREQFWKAYDDIKNFSIVSNNYKKDYFFGLNHLKLKICNYFHWVVVFTVNY